MSDDQIAELVRQVNEDDFVRVSPPAEVWAGIEEAVAAEAISAPTNLQDRRAARTAGATTTAPAAPTGSWVLKAAAAIVLVLGLGGVAVATLGNNSDEGVTVAMASLDDDGLPVSTPAQGAATIVCRDEDCVVELDLTEVPDPGDAVLELWVIDAAVEDMYSLGEVRSSGSFELPAGVTFDDFPIVDISVEPRDGVEAHSGQSVLRGVLEESN